MNYSKEELVQEFLKCKTLEETRKNSKLREVGNEIVSIIGNDPRVIEYEDFLCRDIENSIYDYFYVGEYKGNI